MVTTLEDVSNCPGLATTGPYSHGLSLAEGDQRMMTWFGGIQDQDFVVLVYDVATGCRWYDTNAGATGGQWGPAGPITYRDNKGNVIPTRTHSAIHNARMDRQGDWVRITVQLSPAFMDFWNISTNDVYQCSNQSTGTPPLDGFCDGHVTFGFDHVFLNAIGNTSGPVYSRTLPAVLPYTVPVTNQPAGFGWCCDTHLSWNNALKGQALPVLSSFYQTAAPTLAWQDEVVGMSTDGSGVVWRFGQMYTRAHDFNAQGIANVSRDGKWAIFTSDWGAGRDDVYLIPLR